MEPKQTGNGPLLGVGGLFFAWRAYDALRPSFRYGAPISIGGIIELVLAVTLLVFAYKLMTAKKEPARAPEPTVDPPLPDDEVDEMDGGGDAPDPYDLTIDHPMLQLTMPAGWARVAAPDPLFAMFENQRDTLNVVLGNAPPELAADAILDKMMATHAASLRGNHPRQMDPQPYEIVTKNGIREVTRQYLCQREYSPPWRVTARYATTVDPVGMRGQGFGHPIVQITCYESPWADDAHRELVASALIVPKLVQMDDQATGPRYPYVLHKNTGKQRDEALVHHGRAPEGMRGLVELGNDLFLTVAEDHPQGVRPLFPADLDGEALDEALDEAGQRVARELGTDEIPFHVYEVNVPIVSPIWQPGMHAFLDDLPKMKIVVVGPSWKAASALGSSALYERAAAAIGSGELCAVVPHRDRIFVFPDRGPDNAFIAERIVAAESENAVKPLSPLPFRLRREGLFPARSSQTN